MREIGKEELERMFAMDVIEPTKIKWASPIMFVAKKDDTICFCVDYRKLNEVVIQDSSPVLCMDECID